MSAARENQVLAFNAYDRGNRKQRIAVNGDTAAVLADVFREDVNIATWTRPLSPALLQSVGSVLAGNAPSEVAIIVSPTSVGPALDEVLPGAESRELANDIARLVDMFCSLLGVEKAGLRLSTLYQAMCPKFHVDRIPCRLITTYHGIANRVAATPVGGPYQARPGQFRQNRLRRGALLEPRGRPTDGVW